jgi:cytochrome c553
VPGSSLALTIPQIRDLFNPPDWHPDDHPTMPDIVAHGRKPDVRACGYCHLPNGQGRPENSGLAGLPAGYIAQQMADYKAGFRRSSEPKMGPPAAMLVIGKNANEDESKAAAEYFSHLKFKPWIRVVESSSAPKTRVAGGMLVPVEGAGTEPVGLRIVEMPENLERTELRDSASGFVAYVPVGSIKKGEALVTTGGAGKTLRCAICHGADLKGLANVPPLAGRSPSYTVRQLYDMQNGARTGPWSQLMKEAVAKLTIEDMVAIAAYTASCAP